MDEAMYECLMCKYESPWLFAFQYHRKNRSCPSDDDISQYFDCFQELPSKDQIEVRKHQPGERHHENKWELFERRCDTTSENHREGLKRKRKKQNKALQCSYCNSFKTFYEGCLHRHISKEHGISGINGNWRLCDYCPRKFRREESLREHLHMTHFTSEVCLTCTKCPYKAVSSEDLQSHQQCTGHGNGEAEKLHQCSKCLYGTDSKGDFEKHKLRRHTKFQDVRRWFECTKCPYKAKENKHLTQHILNMHTKENDLKWFECAHCGHKSKNKAHLRGHIVNVHSPDSRQKFKCSSCNFQSFYKATVRRHNLRKHP